VNGKRGVGRLLLGTLTTGTVAAFLLSGCSDVGFFPPVHDVPGPRADTPLTPDQVKQATDALASERDHLNTQLQTNPPPPPANVAAGQQQKPPASAQSGATQTPGADPKQ